MHCWEEAREIWRSQSFCVTELSIPDGTSASCSFWTLGGAKDSQRGPRDGGRQKQKHLQQVMVLLSEVLQALLGLCLVGCQVHDKALESPILCLRGFANVQTSVFQLKCLNRRSILDTQSNAGPCNALLTAYDTEGS